LPQRNLLRFERSCAGGGPSNLRREFHRGCLRIMLAHPLEDAHQQRPGSFSARRMPNRSNPLCGRQVRTALKNDPADRLRDLVLPISLTFLPFYLTTLLPYYLATYLATCIPTFLSTNPAPSPPRGQRIEPLSRCGARLSRSGARTLARRATLSGRTFPECWHPATPLQGLYRNV